MYVSMDHFSNTFSAINDVIATIRQDKDISAETRCVLEHKIFNLTNIALDLYRMGEINGKMQN